MNTVASPSYNSFLTLSNVPFSELSDKARKLAQSKQILTEQAQEIMQLYKEARANLSYWDLFVEMFPDVIQRGVASNLENIRYSASLIEEFKEVNQQLKDIQNDIKTLSETIHQQVIAHEASTSLLFSTELRLQDLIGSVENGCQKAISQLKIAEDAEEHEQNDYPGNSLQITQQTLDAVLAIDTLNSHIQEYNKIIESSGYYNRFSYLPYFHKSGDEILNCEIDAGEQNSTRRTNIMTLQMLRRVRADIERVNRDVTVKKGHLATEIDYYTKLSMQKNLPSLPREFTLIS